MGKKPPLIGKNKPIKEYDLDDVSVRKALGIVNENPARPPKISDRYIRYSNNEYAIVEYKSASLHKAVKQLESSANLLVTAKNQVDYLMVVGEINKAERNLYRQEHRTNRLIDPSRNNKLYRVKVSSYTWEILIFTEQQVNRMYETLNKYVSE